MTSPSLATDPTLPARRVLVVDDEPAIQRLFRKALATHGYLTETASGGLAAIRVLQVADFDVVVSDINMANGDGLGLLRDVRTLGCGVPVILMTGLPSPDVAKRAAALGAFRYVLKPIRPATLRELVDGAVQAHDAVRRSMHSPSMAPTSRIPTLIPSASATPPPSIIPASLAPSSAPETLRMAFERGELTRR